MYIRGPTITDSTVSELLSILTLRYSPILSNTDKKSVVANLKKEIQDKLGINRHAS